MSVFWRSPDIVLCTRSQTPLTLSPPPLTPHWPPGALTQLMAGLEIQPNIWHAPRLEQARRAPKSRLTCCESVCIDTESICIYRKYLYLHLEHAMLCTHNTYYLHGENAKRAKRVDEMIKYRRYATESSLALGQVDKGPAIWC